MDAGKFFRALKSLGRVGIEHAARHTRLAGVGHGTDKTNAAGFLLFMQSSPKKKGRRQCRPDQFNLLSG